MVPEIYMIKAQVELVGWRERRGSVQSSIITRTTHYDAREGGFVTEVAVSFTVLVVILDPVTLSVCVTWEGECTSNENTWQ